MCVLLLIVEAYEKIKRITDCVKVLRLASSFMDKYGLICMYRVGMLIWVSQKASQKYTRIMSSFDIAQ